MADVDLRQRRMQILMERRKAQTNMENKKQELEDEKLKLHHLKTKSMREQWLLGGQLKRTPSQTDMAEKRVMEDEALTERLYENVRRLEEEVRRMECAERELLLREKAVLQKLHPEEPPADGVQQDVETMLPDDDGGVQYIITEIPDLPPGFTLRGAHGDGPSEHGERAAVYAMAISVEKDSKTGETRVVSSTPMSPEDAQSHGVKVYDDGSKVVYAIGHNGQPLTNGVEPMSSEEVDALVSRASPVDVPAASPSPEPKATTNNADDDAPAPTAESPGPAASSASPQAKSPPLAKEAVMGIETKDGLSRVYLQPNAVHGDAADDRAPKPAGDDEGTGGTSIAGGDINPERPVTMVFMGYEQVEDEEETKKALGYEGAGTAELVVIGGDDDDADDATAATPLTADPTTGPVEPPPRATKKPCACRCCTIM
ncbi:paralemmin-1 [Petromyzon marinus]|uniref:Palmdelphin n=1 Tax=Petromyzon marinus TaxID=7757 RepID=A0AAJ7X598_PETMA|nr:palmdelphin [Petromyzon marinus]